MDMGPAWLADILAVLMLVIAGYCLGRLVVWRSQRRPTDVDVDVVHGVWAWAWPPCSCPASARFPT